MKALKLLCVILLAINVKGQNLESVISINEVGLKATFSTYDFDDDGNLYVALNLGITDKEDSTKFVIVNYPKGRDTFYYQYKKRIYLLKLSPKGKLTKLRIDIEDGLDYDFFHDVTDLKIRDSKLYCIVPKILRTQSNYTINGFLTSIENDTCLHYLSIMTFSQKLDLDNVLAYGFDGTNAKTDFFELNNTLLLNIETTINLGNNFVNGEAKYLIGKNGDLIILGDNFDFSILANPSFNANYSNDTITYYQRSFLKNSFAEKKLCEFYTNGILSSNRNFGMISNQNGRFIFFGGFSYWKTYSNGILIRVNRDTSFFENYRITDYFDEPDSTSFSESGALIGFKPDVGSIHWLSGISPIGFQIENGDSVSFFASVEPSGFQYQFRPDTINKKPFSESFYQLALFNVKYDGSLSYKYIANIRNRIGSSNGIDESSFSMHNGSVYFLNNSTDFPDTVTIDSVTGFTYNPNKAIIRYQLFSPPKYVPEILFTQKDCNSGLLEFKSKDAEHYTVLISNDTIRDFPKSGKNYNFSPNYLLAPKLTNDVKILYQGPDTSLNITNLVSERKYFIAVVPGNGLTGKTLYNPDSTAFIEITLNAASSTKTNIYPPRDTSLCAFDSIYAEALTNYTVRWMDGKTDKKWFAVQEDAFSYTIKDSLNCVLSSDTINLGFRPTPKIDSIFTFQKEPFCSGDTISIDVATNGNIVWSNGSRDRTIKTDSSGVYKVWVSNSFGCADSAQIFIKFNPRPYFYFKEDSIIAIDGKVEIVFNTNASTTDFSYLNDTLTMPNFLFSESGLLRANAFYNSGCFVSDSILIKAMESQTEIFPNAFSPNGDGLNDEWYFIHPDTAGTLMVFDRWGGKVYQGTNTWDGKKNGETLPIGSYRYTFIPKDGEIERGLIFIVK